MPEKCWETTVRVNSLDDAGNMIISLYPRSGGNYFGRAGKEKHYFIGPSRNIVPCQVLFDLIRYGLPIAKGCLPGKLKKDKDGILYFARGIEIKKLLKEEFPYYNISNYSTHVWDQNSKGYVVGSIDTIDTIYGFHAFLAVPDWSKNESSQKLQN